MAALGKHLRARQCEEGLLKDQVQTMGNYLEMLLLYSGLLKSDGTISFKSFV